MAPPGETAGGLKGPATPTLASEPCSVRICTHSRGQPKHAWQLSGTLLTVELVEAGRLLRTLVLSVAASMVLARRPGVVIDPLVCSGLKLGLCGPVGSCARASGDIFPFCEVALQRFSRLRRFQRARRDHAGAVGCRDTVGHGAEVQQGRFQDEMSRPSTCRGGVCWTLCGQPNGVGSGSPPQKTIHCTSPTRANEPRRGLGGLAATWAGAQESPVFTLDRRQNRAPK